MVIERVLGQDQLLGTVEKRHLKAEGHASLGKRTFFEQINKIGLVVETSIRSGTKNDKAE